MKKALRQRRIKFHFTFIIISLVLAALTYISIKNIFKEYTVSIVDEIIIPENQTIFYKDLNHDGYSEKILCGKSGDKELYFVTVHNSNGTVRDQFNISSETYYKFVYFYDLNNDGYDEVIIFSKDEQTFFVSVVNAYSLKFIHKEVPIFSKPGEVKTKFWDLNEVIVLFRDFDNDNVTDMLVSPLTGHSIYPRGLYVFDTEEFQLKYSFPTACPINGIRFYDITQNGKQEILAHGGTSGNTRNKVGYHDHTNRLFIFNSKFELINEPFSIGGFPSSFYFDVIRKNNIDHILIIFHNFKNKNPEDSFFILDLNQKVLEKKSLNGQSIYSYYKEDNINSENFFVYFQSGKIVKYDLDFNTVLSTKISGNPFRIIFYDDICEEDGSELVIEAEDRIVVLSQNLEFLFELNFDSRIVNTSLYNSGGAYPNISVSTEKKSYIFRPSKNYFAAFQYPIVILTSILFYIIIRLLHSFLSSVIRKIEAYNYVYDDINVGVIISDDQGKIISYNKSIFHNLQPAASIQKNKNIFSVFNQTPELTQVISEAFRYEKEVTRDVAFSKSDFRFIGKVQVLPLITLFRIPHSFVIKIQNLTQDIENDRSKLWSRTAQKVAHDIKTPLSTIQLNLSALKSRLTGSNIENQSQVNDDIDMIQTEIKQISELTKSFLKFSNLEKPNYQWINPLEIIVKSAEPFKKYFDDGIKFGYEVRPEIKSIWADPNQLIQVFHIFLENSIDAVNENGRIKISAELVEDLQHPANSYVEFVITDNGKGMRKEELNKIFEPYFTLKKDGTGMGLTIAKKIVEDHKGNIEIKSQLNFGTTVIIKLPHSKVEKDD